MNTRAYCFEYRIGVEGEAAAAAALHRTELDIARLEAAMIELETLHSASQFSFEADFEFHLSVARATHNSYFLSTLEAMRLTIRSGMLLAIAPSSLMLETKGKAIRQQHLAVFRAILRRDDVGARQMMREHLSRCRQSTRHWDDVEDPVEFDRQHY
ncbi:FadR/GntR family transcriptional regulator [Neorhizobium tomejilense]|uniref:FadR/GntR family transcriptional regulator n=1 Tax=Neorhizobium tomejilense TaxID=2093828 RepID=UPI003ED0BD9E